MSSFTYSQLDFNIRFCCKNCSFVLSIDSKLYFDNFETARFEFVCDNISLIRHYANRVLAITKNAIIFAQSGDDGYAETLEFNIEHVQNLKSIGSSIIFDYNGDRFINSFRVPKEQIDAKIYTYNDDDFIFGATFAYYDGQKYAKVPLILDCQIIKYINAKHYDSTILAIMRDDRRISLNYLGDYSRLPTKMVRRISQIEYFNICNHSIVMIRKHRDDTYETACSKCGKCCNVPARNNKRKSRQ